MMTMAAKITRVADQDDPQPPVSLENVKAHLKIDDDAEDGLLREYINAAVADIEQKTRRALAMQSYLFQYDRWPRDVTPLVLPLGKIQSITSIQYLDFSGATQTWASSNYQADLASDHKARILPLPARSYPSLGTEYLGAVSVTAVAGYSYDDLPYPLRQAIYLKIATFEQQRGPMDAKADSINMAIDSLIGPYILPFYS